MVKCNLCGNTESFEDVYIRDDVKVMTSKGCENIRVTNVICKECGLVFQAPALSVEYLREFYKDQFEIMSSYDNLDSCKKYIDRFIQKDSSFAVLDVGSNEGYFLNLYRQEGCDVVGVEPSTVGAEKCRKLYGIDVYNDMFENVNFKDKKFNLIILSNILEHVVDPMKVLELARLNLKEKNSWLFLELPNMDSFDYNSIADFYDFQHIYNFSIQVAENYMNLVGFEVIDINTTDRKTGFRIIAKPSKKTNNIINDYEAAKKAVLDYRENRTKNLERMKTLFNDLNKKWKNDESKIYLYGAGLHTAQLFDYVINKNDFNIKGFFDSNEHKDGKEFFGYTCHHASKIREFDVDVIIISSYAYQKEIYDSLSAYEEEGIEVIKLY